MNSQSRTAHPLNNEINVTPMIDVLLVLLITFMASIPVLRKSIDAQLPYREQAHTSNGDVSIVLELDATGAISINRSPVPKGDLGARLHAIYDARSEKVLFVKGNPHVRYESVVDAMDVARGAGVKVIGLP